MGFIWSLTHAAIFSIIGLIILGSAIVIGDKLTPADLWRSIVDEKNSAVATVVGSAIVAASIIISMALVSS